MSRLFIAMCLLALTTCQPVYAASTLLPMPKAQFFTNQGAPLSGGKLYTCLPGTTCGPGTITPKATYTDSSGSVVNANPVILDSAGRADIWLNGFYKVALYTSAGGLVYTVDNVSSNGNTGGGSPIFYNVSALTQTVDLRGVSEIVGVKTDNTVNKVVFIDTRGNTFMGMSSYELTVGGESAHLVLSGGVWYREQ